MLNPSQALQFADKSVLVTGAGFGIGAVHYARNREDVKTVASAIRQAGGQLMP